MKCPPRLQLIKASILSLGNKDLKTKVIFHTQVDDLFFSIFDSSIRQCHFEIAYLSGKACVLIMILMISDI